ncbi:TetR/AcrR family transcriptional regulator [Pseudomonas sp. NPDC088368]|jgi:AcrR family transcriptional regulator|uniref:TetR/AcrR family transcriptional regulator n=1 Tax=Pseudomonas sp. NPDC088368 TaxID=3364453 RepID=UPI003802D457
MARPRKFDEHEVLDRAMEVFWNLGYDGASMAELTKAMNLNAPSIYFAFGSKRGLFDAVLEHYDLHREHYRDSILDAATAREAAERFLFGGIEWLTASDEPPGCLLVQAGLATSASSDIPATLACRRGRIVPFMSERFEQGQLKGNLSKEADVQALARYMLMIFNGLCVQAAAGSSREELEADARRAMMGWPDQPVVQ